MMRSVFFKTIYDKRFFILGWSLGLLAIAMLMASFFPAMRPDGGIDQLLQNMPAAFKGLIGNLADLAQFDTYIATQLFDIRVPLIAGIMAIILALGISVREEEDGELRTILSLPISRTRLFFEKWLALVAIMLVAVLSLVIGVYAITPFIEDATIDFFVLLRLAGMTWLVMVTYGTVAFAAGMATGRRSIASFISILIIIGSFILTTFAQAVDWLKDYEVISLLHYFPAAEIVRDGVKLENFIILASVTLLSLLIAWGMFHNRDIG